MRADVVLALKPDKNPEAMARERAALSGALQQILGEKVEVIVPLSGMVITEGLANGSIDAAFVSATDYLLAQERGAGRLLLVVELNGKTSYESVWVVEAQSALAGVEELQGRAVAFASRTSTSGFTVPYADLVRRGLLQPGERPENFFGEGNVFFGTGYVSAVERVLAGQCEAAAVSDYVMSEDRHLTADQKSRLRILSRQGPVPTHVIAVSRRVSGERQEALRRALLSLDEGGLAELQRSVFGGAFVEKDAEEHVGELRQWVEWVKRISL